VNAFLILGIAFLMEKGVYMHMFPYTLLIEGMLFLTILGGDL